MEHDNEESKLSRKRTGYLEWNEYFMAIAFLSAQRSKDPRTQVGACIVNTEKKIVGIGYNGMPIGCSDDLMPWNRAENGSREKWFESKAPYVCHAELNAVLNKNLADIKGCVIYVALFPCNKCAQIIIQSRISEVIYYSDKYHDRLEFKASRRLFDTAGVKYRQFKPRQKRIIIDFDLIETTPDESPVPPASNNSDGGNKDLTMDNSTSDTCPKDNTSNNMACYQTLSSDKNQNKKRPTIDNCSKPQQSHNPLHSKVYESYFSLFVVLFIVLWPLGLHIVQILLSIMSNSF